MPKFTAEEAFAQGQRDYEIAEEAVAWARKTFSGQPTLEQESKLREWVLVMRYDAHVREGRLAKR
jgi:hypothetical protein